LASRKLALHRASSPSRLWSRAEGCFFPRFLFVTRLGSSDLSLDHIVDFTSACLLSVAALRSLLVPQMLIRGIGFGFFSPFSVPISPFPYTNPFRAAPFRHAPRFLAPWGPPLFTVTLLNLVTPKRSGYCAGRTRTSKSHP